MTTSEYLKLQADLLIAADILRRLGPVLEDMHTTVDQITASGPLLDHHRLPVQVNTELVRTLVRSAMQFNASVVPRKDTARENGQAQSDQRERLRA